MQKTAKRLFNQFVPKGLRPLLKAAVFKPLYFGSAYRCPICNARLRKLLPYGYDYPVIQTQQIVGAGFRHTKCPVCSSIDRERLLYLYLKEETSLFTQPHKLLHIAPEPSLEPLFHAAPTVDYLTADLFRNFMIQLDVTDIQFPDNSFDVILCNHVLEHVPDDQKAMRELRRVLRPDGFAILQVPLSLKLEQTYEDDTIVDKEARKAAFGQADHVRIYGADYQTRLEQTGFYVETFSWQQAAKGFGTPDNVYALNPLEQLFVARKTR